jgi:uncharacterized protein YjiK
MWLAFWNSMQRWKTYLILLFFKVAADETRTLRMERETKWQCVLHLQKQDSTTYAFLWLQTYKADIRSQMLYRLARQISALLVKVRLITVDKYPPDQTNIRRTGHYLPY